MIFEDLAVGGRFLAALPAFLRHPLTPAEARATVRWRLEHRAESFLEFARRAIYAVPTSPNLRLLRSAGCEYGDLTRLVGAEGLEGALHALFDRGVYLTIDELKGRRPVVRGSERFTVDPRDALNPLARNHIPGESGGSRGPRAPAPTDLRRLRDWVAARCVYLEAVGGFKWSHAIWEVPGSLPITNALQFAAMGARPERLFVQVDPASPGLHPRYRWGGRAFRVGSALAGVPMPSLQTVPLFDPLPIAHWMASVLRDGRVPHLYTSSSAAVRVCESANSAGVDLRGARFMLASEPATAARQAAIRRAGAEPTPTYGCMELANIGDACAARRHGDAMHLLHDLHAVIQPGPAAAVRPGLAPKSLLFSSLRRRVGYAALNLSIGDQAEVMPSDCGCPVEAAGWTYQVHGVRSHEKLTAGGMTVLDTDLIRLLEEELPGRFGGGPLDYQLLEEFEGDGRSSLRLLVHPRVGPLDEAGLLDAFLGAVGGGEGANRVLELHWREGQVVRVERAVPRTTPSNKVLHLHTSQHSAGVA